MSPSIDPVARNITIITTTLTALMVLEYLLFLSDEIRLVWPRFWKTTEAKIYVVTRYTGLAGQIFNVWFAFRMASGVLNSPFACRVWSSYQATTIQCLLLSVELLLMLQVHKMYRQDKYIRALSFIFGGTQSAAMAINARLIVTGTHYSPTCVTISPHHSEFYVGISIIVSFTFILVTMLWRFFGSTSGCSEATRAWLKLAVRDSSCITIVITVIFVFMFLCTTRVINTQMSGNITFYLLLFCLWFAAGRIVLHQEQFRRIQESQMGDVNDPSRWTQMIEVDLNGMTPFDDPNACSTSPSGLEVESTEVSTPFDSASGAETKDIADEHLCEWEKDSAPLSSCAPTFMLIERCISGEGSGFKN
ncbi:hypothetical protein EV702DRAFT_395566 [Suillus placidus]|uniref:DUF6533 domain-containing protein n=1 Tax=Suillus placidus TaxID=48579 RepID=A0A9P7D891_9AGAM|nr:hypothetical protein EV702DRAFT_395566 [Suillus placidus]